MYLLSRTQFIYDSHVHWKFAVTYRIQDLHLNTPTRTLRYVSFYLTFKNGFTNGTVSNLLINGAWCCCFMSPSETCWVLDFLYLVAS